MIWLYIALLLLASAVVGFQASHSIKLARFVDAEVKRNTELNEKLVLVSNTLASIRVKHGQTWEVFVPLMTEFEKILGPKENAVFLGQPIDLVYFNDDEVVFVEVKTGNSRLSSRQRHIRRLIEDRKVRWAEVNDMLRQSVNPASQMLEAIPHRE